LIGIQHGIIDGKLNFRITDLVGYQDALLRRLTRHQIALLYQKRGERACGKRELPMALGRKAE